MVARNTPRVAETMLIGPDGGASTIPVGSPAWYTWLEDATTFAFRSTQGSFTARKERRGLRGWYWKAYRKSGGTLHRAYLGKSADLTLDRLIAERRIPPVVVAGVDHAGTDRINEFSPTAANRPGAGGAAEYGRFVVATVLPRLAKDYHVNVNPDGLVLGGSSMGGLVTLWMAVLFPGRVGRLMVMSPSLWWDRRVVLRHLRRHPLDPQPRIWLDAGRKEGASVTRDARELSKLLRRQDRANVKYVEDPRGDHSEVSWGRRLPDALEWLWRCLTYGRRFPLRK